VTLRSLEWHAVAKRLGRWIAYGIPFAVLSLLRVRLVSLTHAERIGHLCIEPDCFIKEGELGLRPRCLPIFLIPRRNAANSALVSFWARRLTIVTSPFWCGVLGRLAFLPGLSYSVTQYAVAIGETARSTAIYAQWKDRPPTLNLTQSERQRGKAELLRLGLPEDAWFVCVHSREGGYSPADEHLHAFRNSDIENYRLAMQAIVDRGGWCIRVGEGNSKKVTPMKGVIDYAHCGMKGDWMDVFLCASCRFFLGNSSGLYLVATVFGRPSALANLTPLSSSLPVGYGDIGIPKLLRKRTTGELLGFARVLKSPVANYRFASQYLEDDLQVEENAPEEIRDLALEMLGRMDGSLQYGAADDTLQQRFRGLLAPGHYSYGAASRIGRDFLRKYASLLDQ
jgi:putative glycosyltransferase (TIGR04372 family)